MTFDALARSPLAGVVFYELIQFNGRDADGFVGASSLERMGVEESLTNLTREFKKVPIGKH